LEDFGQPVQISRLLSQKKKKKKKNKQTNKKNRKRDWGCSSVVDICLESANTCWLQSTEPEFLKIDASGRSYFNYV